MAIITISRGSFSHGKDVAEKVAQRLGYSTLSREVILEASKEFKISQARLDNAIHDAPTIFPRFTNEKQKYIAYVAAEILDHFKNDNVVYHGLAGHFFAKNVSHLLKVRIMANMDDRIAYLMEKENLSRDNAADFLEKDDQERKAWSLQFYGVDTTDLALYDLAIHINKLTVDNAVDLICAAVEQPQFKATPESQQRIENLALAARVKSTLIDDCPSCEVVAEGNSVEITARVSSYTGTTIDEDIKIKALKVPGVASVSVKLTLSTIFS